MTIILKDVNKSNWYKCTTLDMAEEDKLFVAPNVFTIAEWKFEQKNILKAIYSESILIGMMAYCRDDEDGIENLYWLFRLMIETQYQGNGFGAVATSLAIQEMKKLGAKEIRTMYDPKNIRAENLYHRLGFEKIGTLEDGDILLKLNELHS